MLKLSKKIEAEIADAAKFLGKFAACLLLFGAVFAVPYTIVESFGWRGLMLCSLSVLLVPVYLLLYVANNRKRN